MSTHAKLHLTSRERSYLEKLIRSGSAPARTLTKARLLLMTDYSTGGHWTDAAIASALMISMPTLVRVRHRCFEEGVEAAVSDRARSGKPPKITGDLEARLTVLACSDPPEGHCRWTLRLLADRMVELGYVESISHVAIANRLKKMHLSLGESSSGV